MSSLTDRTFSPASRSRLTAHDLARFPDSGLFHRIARAVCAAGCLPRKELYESWEVARRARRRFRGGRVVDLGGGHGLLGQIMLLIDDTSPSAVIVDKTLPASGPKVRDALVRCWPRLAGRVEFVRSDIGAIALTDTDVVVASHACGALTDGLLERAAAAGARVAVLPCCHDLAASDAAGLTGWLDGPLAIDVVRALRLSQRDYRVWTQTIPADITPMNRLLMGAPRTATLARTIAGEPGDRRSAR